MVTFSNNFLNTKSKMFTTYFTFYVKKLGQSSAALTQNIFAVNYHFLVTV